MKLSIAVLASVLTVCSVTIASPVIPSSTKSAESSIWTVIPTANAVSEPDYSEYPIPYDGYGKYCHPLDFDGMMLVKLLAKNTHKLEKATKYINKKESNIACQETLVGELKERLDSVMDDGHGSGIAELESEFIKQNGILEQLKEQLERLFKRHSNWYKKDVGLRSALAEYFAEHGMSGEMTTDGEPNLYSYPGFKKCFDYFYNRS
ncbi:hypothetical protein BATDEDRAFT_92968 [Batrachochytrium dendrobatidis JAM81]|uniref:Uncharacterized protein n=2 Tax=Batrachochytrium dendrobatidis TaxID=109871 RepID=F4PF17_BATDJ|nr:uncharacterized protein BATDEDRAFT_92968 [Batrachochytrium dendrobatidis JAM81]EGF76175.1 hypothetical protein BATDEDRAFT_92968 [Batrachochytrium dendrobatidis JAM81]OAJ44608.1 hypothetical protein BDEG_27810 [Batrachochytrium dendrobatidis JEL423]|eukprot:XP_006683202.1 hypothetical protein BATDEDRAFT_92968 [Batrachochytrium dendrobatidis JAM81]